MLEAAVGIFSLAGHEGFQRALHTTLRVTSLMRICFVLRSSNVTTATFTENLYVFVPCPNLILKRATGPLCSLIRWYQAALEHFPHARLIGKADDDAVWHPERVLASLSGVNTSHALWGQIENFTDREISKNNDEILSGFPEPADAELGIEGYLA